MVEWMIKDDPVMIRIFFVRTHFGNDFFTF